MTPLPLLSAETAGPVSVGIPTLADPRNTTAPDAAHPGGALPFVDLVERVLGTRPAGAGEILPEPAPELPADGDTLSHEASSGLHPGEVPAGDDPAPARDSFEEGDAGPATAEDPRQAGIQPVATSTTPSRSDSSDQAPSPRGHRFPQEVVRAERRAALAGPTSPGTAVSLSSEPTTSEAAVSEPSEECSSTQAAKDGRPDAATVPPDFGLFPSDSQHFESPAPQPSAPPAADATPLPTVRVDQNAATAVPLPPAIPTPAGSLPLPPASSSRTSAPAEELIPAGSQPSAGQPATGIQAPRAEQEGGGIPIHETGMDREPSPSSAGDASATTERAGHADTTSADSSPSPTLSPSRTTTPVTEPRAGAVPAVPAESATPAPDVPPASAETVQARVEHSAVAKPAANEAREAGAVRPQAAGGNQARPAFASDGNISPQGLGRAEVPRVGAPPRTSPRNARAQVVPEALLSQSSRQVTLQSAPARMVGVAAAEASLTSTSTSTSVRIPTAGGLADAARVPAATASASASVPAPSPSAERAAPGEPSASSASFPTDPSTHAEAALNPPGIASNYPAGASGFSEAFSNYPDGPSGDSEAGPFGQERPAEHGVGHEVKIDDAAPMTDSSRPASASTQTGLEGLEAGALAVATPGPESELARPSGAGERAQDAVGQAPERHELSKEAGEQRVGSARAPFLVDAKPDARSEAASTAEPAAAKGATGPLGVTAAQTTPSETEPSDRSRDRQEVPKPAPVAPAVPEFQRRQRSTSVPDELAAQAVEAIRRQGYETESFLVGRMRGGTPIAEVGEAMRKGRKPTKPAEAGANFLPAGGKTSTARQAELAAPAAAMNRAPEVAPRTADRLSDLQLEDLAMSPPRFPRWEETKSAERGSSAPLSAIERMSRLEGLISREVVAVRQLGAHGLSVLLRPDSQTDLLVQLRPSQNGVEAAVQCDRGNLQELQAHWPMLREALAEQNIRLLPLQSTATSQGETPGQGSGRSFTSDERAARQGHLGGDGRGTEQGHDPRNRGQSAGPGTSRTPEHGGPSTARGRGARRDGWEFWA